MADQILRDRSGNMIGRITEWSGKYLLYDRSGNRLGQYDPKINATFDASGNRVGSGNILTTLLR